MLCCETAVGCFFDGIFKGGRVPLLARKRGSGPNLTQAEAADWASVWIELLRLSWCAHYCEGAKKEKLCARQKRAAADALYCSPAGTRRSWESAFSVEHTNPSPVPYWMAKRFVRSTCTSWEYIRLASIHFLSCIANTFLLSPFTIVKYKSQC